MYTLITLCVFFVVVLFSLIYCMRQQMQGKDLFLVLCFLFYTISILGQQIIEQTRLLDNM